MIVPILCVLAVAVILAIAVLVVIASRGPAKSCVTRSTLISASPAVVFGQVNDLHKWEAWSPWAKMDPAARTSYEGPVAGTGAAFTWDGNAKVGKGRMTIVESRTDEAIRFRMDFLKPFASTAHADWAFKPEGNQTTVTWSMTGVRNLMVKIVSVFIDCDKMVGGQFEQGLADLKVIAEAEAKK